MFYEKRANGETFIKEKKMMILSFCRKSENLWYLSHNLLHLPYSAPCYGTDSGHSSTCRRSEETGLSAPSFKPGVVFSVWEDHLCFPSLLFCVRALFQADTARKGKGPSSESLKIKEIKLLLPQHAHREELPPWERPGQKTRVCHSFLGPHTQWNCLF